MDVIKGLPKVHRKFVILTVVDRIYAHFIALGHLYTAASVARVFFEGIVCLHGFPTFIVNDRDPVFTSNMWHDLFKQAGVKFLLSTAFNTQMDGQSEVVTQGDRHARHRCPLATTPPRRGFKPRPRPSYSVAQSR